MLGVRRSGRHRRERAGVLGVRRPGDVPGLRRGARPRDGPDRLTLPISDHPWGDDTRGLLVLPSGRRVRGRALRRPLPAGQEPEHGLYLLGSAPAETSWPQRWLRWPDLRLPRDAEDAVEAVREAWELSAQRRVEVACGGGRGRTGTALACLAVLDGVPPAQAVAFVRAHYDRRAVETPWQRRWVERFPG